MQIKTRSTYYKDENFLLEYEIYNDKVFLHCLVEHFNSRVLRQMYNVFVRMQEEFTNYGFKQMVTLTPNPKFCELFNGKREKQFMFQEKEYEVVVWELKQQS